MPSRVTLAAVRSATLLAALALLAACPRANDAKPGTAVTSAPDTAAANVDTAPANASPINITRSDFAAALAVGAPVTIDNPYGDVHVRFGGFEHKVDGHVVLQEPAGAAHIDLQPGTVDGRYVVAPRLPANATLREGQRLDLSVFVPEGHDLRVTTEQGLIDVRGVHGAVDLATVGGDITLRAIQGAIQAQTRDGTIEASLGTAPRGAHQRLATTTGSLQVGVDDDLDAAVRMATSAQFATDYSLQVERRTGEEPNKIARSVIGGNHSTLALDSKRGEIRLIRRARFTSVGDAPPADDDAREDSDSD
jgi:hypothetical protein